jgi:hypothetical protein
MKLNYMSTFSGEGQLVIIRAPYLDSQPIPSLSYCWVAAQTDEEGFPHLGDFFVDILLPFFYIRLISKQVLIIHYHWEAKNENEMVRIGSCGNRCSPYITHPRSR